MHRFRKKLLCIGGIAANIGLLLGATQLILWVMEISKIFGVAAIFLTIGSICYFVAE